MQLLITTQCIYTSTEIVNMPIEWYIGTTRSLWYFFFISRLAVKCDFHSHLSRSLPAHHLWIPDRTGCYGILLYRFSFSNWVILQGSSRICGCLFLWCKGSLANHFSPTSVHSGHIYVEKVGRFDPMYYDLSINVHFILIFTSKIVFELA